MKRLHWSDKWVEHITEIVNEALDPESLAIFPDMTTPQRLVTNWTQAEYTRILSSLLVGVEFAYPELAQQTYYDFLKLSNAEVTPEDFCEDYTLDTASIIAFEPQDPYTDPELVPDGYLMPPFWIVGDVLPEFLPDWFQELITDIIEQFTGYEDDDILTTIGSFPLFANWSELLTNGLPRIAITLENAGTLELHFLNVPFGGRALVSVDIEFDPIDIIDGIITEGFKLVELERDYSSIPPELDVDNIEEIVIEGSGTHTIYITFLPVVDVTAFPLKFGGGIRKINWCPDNIPDEPCEECPEPTIEELLEDEEFFQTEYLPKTLGTKYSNTETRNEALETAYDTTPQSIGAEIPTGTPDDEEKNALCAALLRFVRLYCSEKICVIQSRNFLEIAYDTLEDAAESFYDDTLDQMLGNWSDNLFGCIVDVPTALTALADEAAQEDLACYLLDQLDGGAISESAFNTAIDNAATSLSGNEQAIACVMSEDYALSLALNFFQAYNTALLQSAENEDVDCPCITQTYRLWKHDFANGMGDFRPTYNANGNPQGTIVGGEFVGSQFGSTTKIASFTLDLQQPWRIKGAKILFKREGTTTGNFIMRWRPTPNNNTGALNPSIGSGGGVSPYSAGCQNINLAASPPYMTNMREFFFFAEAIGTMPVDIKIKSVEILYYDGFHDSGYPTADADLCT